MIQGTTPTHIFEIPFGVELIAKAKITYAQQGEVVLEKETEDLNLDDNIITVMLSQEETFRFSAGSKVNIQIRILTKGGEALASVPQSISAIECLDGEVLK